MAVKKKTVKKKAAKKRSTKGGAADARKKPRTSEERLSTHPRLGLNRSVRHEEMRQKIQGTDRVREINGLYEDLHGLDKRARELAEMRTITEGFDYALEDERVSINLQHSIKKTMLDVQYRMLAKVLPDEKSIEIVDPDGNNPFDKFVKGFKDLVKDQA